MVITFLKKEKKLLSKTFRICVLYGNVFPFGAFLSAFLLAIFSDIPPKDKFHNKHSYTCLEYVSLMFHVLSLYLSILPFSSTTHHFYLTNFKLNSRCRYTWECFEKAWDDLPVSCCPGTSTSWVPGLRELKSVAKCIV